MQNKAKAICSAWTGGIFVSAPKSPLKREYQRLTRLSYAFAWLADLSLMYLGGDLKRKERLSARLADGMSYLYLAMAALRYCQANGDDVDQRIHAKWAVSYCFYHAQKSMIAFCHNFPSRILGMLIRFSVFPGGQSMRYPSDKMDHKLAQLMTQNNSFRDMLLKSVYLSGDPKQPIDKMEHALQLMISNADRYQKIHDLKRFKSIYLTEKLAEKVAAGTLSQEDMDALVAVEQARWDAIQVDEFLPQDMDKKTFASRTDDVPSPFADLK